MKFAFLNGHLNGNSNNYGGVVETQPILVLVISIYM